MPQGLFITCGFANLTSTVAKTITIKVVEVFTTIAIVVVFQNIMLLVISTVLGRQLHVRKSYLTPSFNTYHHVAR